MILCLLALIALSSASNYSVATPNWVTSNFFRAGNQKVINSLTGKNSLPQFTFVFSTPVNGTPSLAYGVKNYRGNDYLIQQFFQIRKIGLNETTYTVQIQIYGITNIWVMAIAYIAIQKNFPHHLNSFDNVPLNYSSGNIVNISVRSYVPKYFTQYVNYSAQASAQPFNTFSSNLTHYKMVLFMTSLWIRTASGYTFKIRIDPQIVNQTHYKWTALVQFQTTVTRLQFSQIIFDQNDIQNSNRYFVVYEQWITDINGGFKEIPIQFVDNFIMAVTDFTTVDGQCGFEYNWQYVNSTNGTNSTNSTNGTFGVQVLYSWTLTSTCGFEYTRNSIFYIKTWVCNPPYHYFNLTSDSCQDGCAAGYIANTTAFTCQLASSIPSPPTPTPTPTPPAPVSNISLILVTGFIKNPTSNSATITLKIFPQSSSNNITSSIGLNFPYDQPLIFQVDNITGTIKVTFSYNESLNDQSNLAVTFNNNGVLLSTPLPPITDNNLALKYYSQNDYQLHQSMNKLSLAISIIAVSVFCLGLVVSRIISIQMILLFQFTYCSLIMIKKQQALMSPLKALWITNGFNVLATDEQTLPIPPPITQMYYKAAFLSNFNFDFIVLFLPFLVGIILLIVAQFTQSQRLSIWWKRAFKQWSFSATLFILFQLVFAFVLNFAFALQKIVGIVLGCILLISVLIHCVIFYKWPENYGQYKYFFNETPLCQNVYLFIIFLRILLAFMLVFFSQIIASSIAALTISVIWTILLFIFRPYKRNIRPIGNSIMLATIAALFLYTQTQQSTIQINFASYLPILIAVVLPFNIFFNAYFFISHILFPRDAQTSNTIANAQLEITQQAIGPQDEKKYDCQSKKHKNSHQYLQNESILKRQSRDMQFLQKVRVNNNLPSKKRKRRVRINNTNTSDSYRPQQEQSKVWLGKSNQFPNIGWALQIQQIESNKDENHKNQQIRSQNTDENSEDNEQMFY